MRWRHAWHLLYEAEEHSVDQNVLERNPVPSVLLLFAFSCWFIRGRCDKSCVSGYTLWLPVLVKDISHRFSVQIHMNVYDQSDFILDRLGTVSESPLGQLVAFKNIYSRTNFRQWFFLMKKIKNYIIRKLYRHTTVKHCQYHLIHCWDSSMNITFRCLYMLWA